MKNLKWLFIGLLSSTLFLTSCGLGDDDGIFNCETGEGTVITEELSVSEFTGVELDVAADVYITQGNTFGVSVEGQSNIIDKLELNVLGDVWHICFNGCVRNYTDLKIYITMPTVDFLAIDGSGHIVGENFFEVDDIELKISGSGDIDLALTADDITAKTSGSGAMLLEGDAQKIKYKVSGSGDLRAFDLIVEKADITITGSGSAEVNVTDDLDVKISGSGSVFFKGNPQLTVDISGSGEVVSVN